MKARVGKILMTERFEDLLEPAPSNLFGGGDREWIVARYVRSVSDLRSGIDAVCIHAFPPLRCTGICFEGVQELRTDVMEWTETGQRSRKKFSLSVKVEAQLLSLKYRRRC